MQKIIKFLQIISLIACFNSVIALAEINIKPGVIEKAKKAIVTIQARVSLSAYKFPGSWSGTGFIADKKNGLIVTNAHVVGRAAIGTYFVTFDTGQQAEAKLAYYDVWQDQAILKVDPASVPDVAEEILFNPDEPSLNQTVFIVGNNEGQEFSVHHGNLSNLYDINGEMPQHSYIISLNAAGGSSGSPIINMKGQAIGLNYGSGGTFAIALKGDYVIKALKAVKANKPAKRQHIGVICQLYSLDKAVKHRKFPKEVMDKYVKDFPDTRNRVVAVKNTLNSSPAFKELKPGDIIWAVNDQKVAASLYVLDNAMDNAKDSVKLTIYRNGEKLDKVIKLYDIEANKVSKMLNFAGATFFQADDYCSDKSGILIGGLMIVNVQTGSSFSAIPLSFTQSDREYYRLAVSSIDSNPLSNLDDLIRVVPDLIAKKFITVDFKNRQPVFQPLDNILISDHADFSSDITLDSIETKPRVFQYDAARLEWVGVDL